VVYGEDGRPKGNCDADFVLQTTKDYYENNCERAVIVSSDGDYASLVKFLIDNKRLLVVLSPARKEKCSILLKRTGATISYINDQRSILYLSKKKKPPLRTKS